MWLLLLVPEKEKPESACTLKGTARSCSAVTAFYQPVPLADKGEGEWDDEKEKFAHELSGTADGVIVVLARCTCSNNSLVRRRTHEKISAKVNKASARLKGFNVTHRGYAGTRGTLVIRSVIEDDIPEKTYDF